MSFPARSREQLLAELRRGVEALGRVLPVERAVLFGSQATGRHTASSDVDLLVVYADPPRPDAFALVHRAVAVRGLEPHVYSRSEAEGLRDTLDRMTRGGIPIPSGPAGTPTTA